MKKKISFIHQVNQMDCGPTCLAMVTKYLGRSFKLRTLRELCEANREGVSMHDMSRAGESIGLKSTAVKIDLKQLSEAPLPAILHWRQNHFVVLYKIRNEQYYLADPASGLIKLSQPAFTNGWQNGDINEEGIALLLSATDEFYRHENEKDEHVGWLTVLRYFVAYRKLFIQLIFGLMIGSLLQLVAPFLTQSIVDVGINTRSVNFIYIILIAQVALIVGRVSVEFIRSWILLHISIRVNISILTDFLIKLMRLPISYFDTKMTGDILQRISDQRIIQDFLTGTALSTLFSLFNLVVFSVVLMYYNRTIFLVFVVCSILYAFWIILFLKRRKELNYKNFEISASNQGNIVQLISGMQEIKLNNAEQEKRWEWERIQARLFQFNIKSLALNQYQQGGATFINEGKNIAITFVSAEAVITGHLTLGAMVAIQYIIGQLNGPIEQILGFVKGFQDTRISLERLNEIHQLADEEDDEKEWREELPADTSLYLKNVTFYYPGTGDRPVLRNINLAIPQNKTTAIVGMSGSGKTTLLKLLLRFYEPQSGDILVGHEPVREIGFKTWRKYCGVVMQDGFIFSDSIERNITVGDSDPDQEKLKNALHIANIQQFVDSLPLGLKTQIGAEGNGLSQGQRQRLLIARAVYKDPEFIFFDEATNSLDANNEHVIMHNLYGFFKNRTVVIVAHRLSTVSNADNIIVLDSGRISEQGTHAELIGLKGAYYKLVKNQLELGT